MVHFKIVKIFSKYPRPHCLSQCLCLCLRLWACPCRWQRRHLRCVSVLLLLPAACSSSCTVTRIILHSSCRLGSYACQPYNAAHQQQNGGGGKCNMCSELLRAPSALLPLGEGFFYSHKQIWVAAWECVCASFSLFELVCVRAPPSRSVGKFSEFLLLVLALFLNKSPFFSTCCTLYKWRKMGMMYFSSRSNIY